MGKNDKTLNVLIIFKQPSCTKVKKDKHKQMKNNIITDQLSVFSFSFTVTILLRTEFHYRLM